MGVGGGKRYVRSVSTFLPEIWSGLNDLGRQGGWSGMDRKNKERTISFLGLKHQQFCSLETARSEDSELKFVCVDLDDEVFPRYVSPQKPGQ